MTSATTSMEKDSMIMLLRQTLDYIESIDTDVKMIDSTLRMAIMLLEVSDSDMVPIPCADITNTKMDLVHIKKSIVTARNAITNIHTKITQMMTPKKPVSRIDDWIHAIKVNDIPFAKYLLPVANEHNKDGDTALHLAASYNRIEITKILIDAKADVNLQNKLGQTALHRAVQENNIDIARLLIDAQADVNLQDNNRENALFYAVSRMTTGNRSNANIDMIRLLINAKVDINQQDEHGYSVLHTAVDQDVNSLIIKVLLAAGVNVKLKNKYGHTALDNAITEGKYQMIKDLLRYTMPTQLQDDAVLDALFTNTIFKSMLNRMD